MQTCWIPDRHFAREISLLELRRAGWIGAVVRQRAHRDAIAATRDDFAQHIAHEFRCALEFTVAVGEKPEQLRPGRLSLRKGEGEGEGFPV